VSPDQPPHTIYIDTPPAYYQDRFFDTSNAMLNRDDTLVPYARLREICGAQGIEVRTADYLMQQPAGTATSEYYSLGVLDNIHELVHRAEVRMCAFVVFEPPVVDPSLYKALPELTAAFERVYIHNTHGDGYSLAGVDVSKLRKLYWPQPRKDVIESFWSRDARLNRIVVICGNHIPRKVSNELYSRRIEAMAELAQLNVVDLYGRGWSKWWSRASMWLPYWKNRSTLMSIYKGACESKYEVLSQYKFSLCLENMAMEGYVTEKIFDCFYAGTIPLYLGAQDISTLISSEAYIDCRKFKSWSEMHRALMEISTSDIAHMRNAGREFVRSESGLKFYNSLEHIFFQN